MYRAQDMLRWCIVYEMHNFPASIVKSVEFFWCFGDLKRFKVIQMNAVVFTPIIVFFVDQFYVRHIWINQRLFFDVDQTR